jgi:hypothetical protein
MHVEPGERDAVRWESWLRYAQLARALADRPRRILSGYLSAYAALSRAQQDTLSQTIRKELLAMQDPVDEDLAWLPVPLPYLQRKRIRELEAREKRALEQAVEQAVEKAVEQAQVESRREAALRLCLRVLETKLGPLGAPMREAVGQLPEQRLEDLAAAVFGLADEDALRRWLAG